MRSGIGFDVAEFLVGDAAEGKPTGWSLKKRLSQAHLSMISGVDYSCMDDAGLHYFANGGRHLLDGHDLH